MPGEIHHLIALDLNVRGLSEVKKRTTTSVTVIKQLVTQALKLGLEVSRIERDIDGKISVVTTKPVCTESETPTDIKRLM